MSSTTLPRSAGFRPDVPLSPVRIIARLITRITLMQAVRHQRQVLAQLDARTLADIGITPAAAAAEARRPAWDLPHAWTV
jgi:uncharacterized protein YjiS (DUF1127 family)